MAGGGMRGGGRNAWQGACMVGGVHEGHAWQEKWQLQRECILVHCKSAMRILPMTMFVRFVK